MKMSDEMKNAAGPGKEHPPFAGNEKIINKIRRLRIFKHKPSVLKSANLINI